MYVRFDLLLLLGRPSDGLSLKPNMRLELRPLYDLCLYYPVSACVSVCVRVCEYDEHVRVCIYTYMRVCVHVSVCACTCVYAHQYFNVSSVCVCVCVTT